MKTPAYHLSAPARWSSLFLLAPAFLFLSSGCIKPVANHDAAPTTSGPANTTYPMPPLSSFAQMGWIDANSQRSRLSDYHGKVLVLDFYATWCEPCRQSIPRLNELQKQYGAHGIAMVGLNVGGPDDRIKVPAFARELNIQYPLGFPDKALTDLFLSDDQTIPQTFIFGRGGTLAKRLVGYDPASGAEMEEAIKTELKRSDR